MLLLLSVLGLAQAGTLPRHLVVEYDPSVADADLPFTAGVPLPSNGARCDVDVTVDASGRVTFADTPSCSTDSAPASLLAVRAARFRAGDMAGSWTVTARWRSGSLPAPPDAAGATATRTETFDDGILYGGVATVTRREAPRAATGAATRVSATLFVDTAGRVAAVFPTSGQGAAAASTFEAAARWTFAVRKGPDSQAAPFAWDVAWLLVGR